MVWVAMCAVMLSACSQMPDWMGGSPLPIKRVAGERVDVVAGSAALTADASVADVPVDVPDQTNLEAWTSLNDAMLTGHIGLTGVTRDQSATIGDGHDFTRNTVTTPVVSGNMVYAMDAAGVISAHAEADISDVRWTDETDLADGVKDVLGGGLAIVDGVLYATTGTGGLRALDALSGTPKWTARIGAPVRGAPAVSGGLVLVLTADNQTLAYDAATGQPRWEHRGIRETAGYFATTSPVISDGIVISAYSSGEVFALRLETGSVLWSDSLGSTSRTRASGVFTGIGADPIVQDGVVVVTSASGEMQASALLNGRPLWQQKIGAHTTPWSAGNVLYVLSDTNDIAAVLKRDGSIRWATSMAVKDDRDTNTKAAPALYGPILSANAVLVIDAEGNLNSFKPTTGESLGAYELDSGVISDPIVVNGAMYVITKDAKLRKYY
jgi:outer membrane protein assembly factor BamB